MSAPPVYTGARSIRAHTEHGGTQPTGARRPALLAQRTHRRRPDARELRQLVVGAMEPHSRSRQQLLCLRWCERLEVDGRNGFRV